MCFDRIVQINLPNHADKYSADVGGLLQKGGQGGHCFGISIGGNGYKYFLVSGCVAVIVVVYGQGWRAAIVEWNVAIIDTS